MEKVVEFVHLLAPHFRRCRDWNHDSFLDEGSLWLWRASLSVTHGVPLVTRNFCHLSKHGRRPVMVTAALELVWLLSDLK